MIGTSIGTYRITAKLGAGGMGEVYRAHDTKLKRDVALKVLPEAFARDPERLARFEREAEVLASLNHPNIAAIYGVVEDRALVMELVEGAEPKGPLPFDEVWAIASQIATALEYAHEKGVVHRDLKPANIKVTPEGTVKLLDFGLAKAFSNQPDAAANPENSPTLTMGTTQFGVILGTAAYMSPEQAKGKSVDKRADIWAFGVVLYELLTGERLFKGEDVSETLAQVLTKEPDLDKIPPKTRRLLNSCLEKDPKRRLRDVGDAKRLIEERPAQSAPSHLRFGLIAAVVAIITTLALAVLALMHFRETPPADPVLHLSVQLPANAAVGYLALSPDGWRLVIYLTREGKSQLWLRSLDSPRLQPLPDTENGRNPFWSSDGKFVGFFADGKLKTVSAAGGPAKVLCEGTGNGTGGTWNRDGVILFGVNPSGVSAPLQRVNASGGACTAVTMPEGESRHVHPEFLPDGKQFVFVVTGGDEAKRGLYVASLDNPAPRRLLADQSSAIFMPSTTGKKYGYLLFLRGNEIIAQPFNADTRQISGDVFPVAPDGSFSLTNFTVAASASAGGVLAYEANLRGAGFQLTWLDRSGKELGTVGTIQNERHVALSPDGKLAATVRADLGISIWLHDMLRGAETRFTSPALPGGAPVWSPDGKMIAFGAGRGLYSKDASSGLKEELLLENGNGKTPSDWSRDGHYLIYTESDPKGQGDIWYLPDPLKRSGEQKPVRFQGTDAIESQGQLSPDGRWLAYTSDESGEFEVYVRPFPSGQGRWKVSAGRGFSREPRWRRDGKELFFLEAEIPNHRLMAVSMQSGSGGDLQVGAPQPLFEFRSASTVAPANHFLYSPSADGQRFLVIVQASGAETTLNVITNWEKAALGVK